VGADQMHLREERPAHHVRRCLIAAAALHQSGGRLIDLDSQVGELLALDPWTLADLVRHLDMNITKATCIRQEKTICAVLDRARGISGWHTFGHTGQNLNPGKNALGSQPLEAERFLARP
jgi:hypothetical protein